MRTALTAVALALVLGCVYEATEIGRFEAAQDEGGLDPTSGSSAVDWYATQLHHGTTLVAELGSIDMEAHTFGAGVHRIVIEVVPLQPATLPESFTASIHPVDGDAEFEPSDAGLRYEGDLELGWSVELHADEPCTVELRAQIIPP
jgi:hypothetical protein